MHRIRRLAAVMALTGLILTSCGGSDSYFMNSGRRSWALVKPALVLKSRSVFSTRAPSWLNWSRSRSMSNLALIMSMSAGMHTGSSRMGNATKMHMPALSMAAVAICRFLESSTCPSF